MTCTNAEAARAARPSIFKLALRYRTADFSDIPFASDSTLKTLRAVHVREIQFGLALFCGRFVSLGIEK